MDNFEGSGLPLYGRCLQVSTCVWGPNKLRWRRLGQDGVLELQVSGAEWVSRKMSAQGIKTRLSRQHEHLLTEQSMQAADVKFPGIDRTPSVGPVVQDMKQSTTSSRSSPTTSSSTRIHGRAVKADDRQVGQIRPAVHRASRMACIWTALMACSAALSAVPAVPISHCGQPISLGGAGRDDGQQWGLLQETLSVCKDSGRFSLRHVSNWLGNVPRFGIPSNS